MKPKTSGADHVAKSWLASHYKELLAPIGMYMDRMDRMLFFQQSRFYKLSGIRCFLSKPKRVRSRKWVPEPECHHVACPLCWHRATLSHLTRLAGLRHSGGFRVRTVTGVPAAVNVASFIEGLTQGEVPLVYDRRCELSDADTLRVVVLSAIRDVNPDDGRQEPAVCAEDEVQVVTVDRVTVEAALEVWFAEAPPPFTQAGYEDFVRLTMGFVFEENIHVFPAARSAEQGEVDASLLDL